MDLWVTGKHRAPRLWPTVLAVALIVAAMVALLCLTVPILPLPVIYRPDVRAPVPMPARTYFPTPDPDPTPAKTDKSETTPRPDPTRLTTQAADRALAAYREVIEVRLDGMDKAV